MEPITTIGLISVGVAIGVAAMGAFCWVKCVRNRLRSASYDSYIEAP
jgi:hypothetical protein